MPLIAYFPICVALFIYMARMIELRWKRDVISGPVQENLTFRLFFLTGIIMLIGGIIEYLRLRKTNFSWDGLIAGICIGIFAFWLRWQAIKALGRFWSLHIEIRESHEFVKSGPFQYVRHPTYFSMILELLSVGLVLNAWWMLLIVPLLFVPTLILRIDKEEQALIEKFGQLYAEYRKSTPAIIPFTTFLKK